MSIVSTPTGYTVRLDANASGFAFSGLQRIPTADEAKYIVWVSGSLYQTFNTARGLVEYSGASAYDAIKVAQSGAHGFGNAINPFSGESEIVIKEGGYYFGSGFTGFNLREKTNITMAYNTHLIVPTFYSGHVFNLHGKIEHVSIRGGVIAESGTAADLNDSGRLWTAFHFHASGSTRGITYTKIEDVVIWNPNYGFHVDCSDQGWFNSNIIRDCIVSQPVKGVVFTAASGALLSQGANSNDFINITVQAVSGTSRVGVEAESGRLARNTFIDCTMWDFAPSSGTVSARLGGECNDTIIINGAMTYRNFVDSGVGTRIFDAYTPPQFDIVNFYPGSGAASPTINFYNADESERYRIQKIVGSNIVVDSIREASAGSNRAVVHRMWDTVASTLIEPMRLDTSGNVEFNRSGGTVQFKSGNTSTTASGTNANSGFFNPKGFITARLGTSAIKIPFFD